MPTVNHTVSLTLKQRLCCLLAVTEAEADLLLRAGAVGTDTAAIGRRVRLSQHEVEHILASRSAIECARIDVNKVSSLQLYQVPSMAPERIRLVEEGQPYFSLCEFEEASGLSETLIHELFTVASLELLDKVTGRSQQFQPVFGKYIARPRLEFESARSLTHIGFAEYGTGSNHTIRVIAPDDTEICQKCYQLKNVLGGQASPVVKDASACERYFIPAGVDVWFRSGVFRQQALTILNAVGLREITSREMVGYYQAELGDYPADRHLLAATLRTIHQLLVYDEVEFAEPAEVGLDDFMPEHEQPLPDFERSTGYDRMWNVDAIDLNAAHELTEGSESVTVLVIDSGMQTEHQDLIGALRPDWASLDLNFDVGVPESVLSPSESDIAHGTKVAGIICGRSPGGSRVKGIAPGCWLLPVKISGTPYGQSYGLRAAAIREAITYIQPGHRGVLNLSWSTQGDHQGIREALFKASEKGIAITTSAGNYGVGDIQRPDTPHYPSGYAFLPGDTAVDVQERRKIPGLVSVAAVNALNHKATYSYYGAHSVTVAAPGGEPGLAGMGVFVASTPETYTYEAGTSFAAPHVAGLLALLFSVKPELTAQEAVDVICRTATDLDAANPSYVGMLGAGLINAQAALKSLDLAKEKPVIPVSDDTITSGESSRLNINTATTEQWSQLPYIGIWSATVIVSYREEHGPFHTIDELLKTGAIDDWTLTQIAPQLTAGPIAPVSLVTPEAGSGGDSLVNINAADVMQLEQLPLIGRWCAQQIVSYRQVNGPFSRIGDLVRTGAVDSWTIGQIQHVLTLG